MAREYAKTNLTIWQDPEWRALPWPAQHVYKMFWEHPGLSYCGVVDWRPSKMLGWGAGWTRDDMQSLTDCLRARHFLVVDEDTEECLIRSWIRFDGVVKQPRLAVSMCNAFGEVGSNTIRGVIVDELHKIKKIDPDAAGWAKPQTADILRFPRIHAKDLPTPEDPFGSGFGITLGRVSGSVSVPVSPAFGPNAEEGFGTGLGTPYNSNSTTTTTTLHHDDPGAAASEKKKPARRLPGDFRPTDDHISLATGLGVDLDHEFAKFCDYWRSEGRPKADWNATLRNWIRKAAENPRGNVRPIQRTSPSGEPIIPLALDDRR